MKGQRLIPIWFFIGALLLVYGVLILSAGIATAGEPTDVVLSELHAGIWWGLLLILVGAFYCVRFRPGR